MQGLCAREGTLSLLPLQRLMLLPNRSEGSDRQTSGRGTKIPNTEKDADIPKNWDKYEPLLQMSITGRLQNLVKNRYAGFFVHMSKRVTPSDQIPITLFSPNS